MKFYVDTNVLTQRALTVQLAAAFEGSSHQLCVPAAVAVECLFRWSRQWRKKNSVAFNQSLALQQRITDRGISLTPLDEAAVLVLAAHLSARFPTDEDWTKAKWAACRPGEQRTTRKISAPLDFYLCAPSPDAPVITSDTGGEWRSLPRGSVFNPDEAIAFIQRNP